MPLKRRSRTIQPDNPVLGKLFFTPAGSPLPTSVTTGVYQPRVGNQITDSEGHPFKSRKKRGLSDLGGEFRTEKQWQDGLTNAPFNRFSFPASPAGSTLTYEGPIFPILPHQWSYPPASLVESSNSALDKAGATAIARCKPTNSVANLSVFLGETLKEGIPKFIGHTLWKDRTARAKDAGDEFLNVEYGWLPLVSEIKNLAHATRKVETTMRQFERDSGKVVRRRYEFPVQKWVQIYTEPINTGAGVPLQPDDYQARDLHYLAPTITIRSFERRQWFSGAFTYHLPRGYDSRKAMARAAQEAKMVFGLSLTPSTVWNLTPWSWAADWFTNTGDVLSNVSDWASYGLVMHYGYLMEHSIVRDTITNASQPFKTAKPVQVSALTNITEVKKRRKANPFGFGITWDGLSPIQLAITAALGISRS